MMQTAKNTGTALIGDTRMMRADIGSAFACYTGNAQDLADVKRVRRIQIVEAGDLLPGDAGHLCLVAGCDFG